MLKPNNNPLLEYLRERSPDAYKKLASAYPDQIAADPTNVGSTVNEEPEVLTRDIASPTSELAYKAELAQQALGTALIDARNLLPRLRKKLSNLKTLSLVSKIITAISGASLIATISEGNDRISYILAGLTLVASLLDLFMQHQRSGLFGESSGLEQTYNDLVDHRWTAEKLSDELKVIHKFTAKDPNAEAEVNPVINQTKDLIIKLRTCIDKYI